jgi:hypothetical protein
MLRLMLLGLLVGFVPGITGGWINPTSAAEITTAQVSDSRSEPSSSPAIMPTERADAREESSGSGRAARKRKQLNARLDAMASRKPAHQRTSTEIDDEDDE